MNLHFDISNLPYDENEFPLPFSKSYLNFFREQGFKILIAEEETCFIPIAIEKKFLFTIGRFLYAPFNIKSDISPDAEKIFLESLREKLSKETQVDFLLPPVHICTFKTIPSRSYYKQIGIIQLPLDN